MPLPWPKGRVVAAAATAAGALCIAVLLLNTRSGGAWPFAPAPAANEQRAPPRPCLLNTLLRAEDVQWSLRNGTADRLSIRGCPLQRFSQAQAQQCLKGKRLVFVGDSVTRYQYLTLLHFLDKGAWPAPLGGVPGQPSVANEHEWPSWNDFLRGTSALFGGRELCDCYREEYDPARKYRPREEDKHENRFYTSADGSVSVSHFTYTTEPNKVHGHFGFPPFAGEAEPCAPATCSAPADWAHNLIVSIKKPIAATKPTHLILNSGLWGSSNAIGNQSWVSLGLAGKLAVAGQEGRVFWRTTTASSGKKSTVTRDTDALAVQHAAAAGWGLLDAFAITRPLLDMPEPPLWDGRHFLAVVYRELNIYMLNMFCGPYAMQRAACPTPGCALRGLHF